MMRQIITFTTAFIILSLFFTSCHTGQQYATHRSSRQPKFMGDVYLTPHVADLESKPIAKSPVIKKIVPEPIVEEAKDEEPEVAVEAPVAESKVTIIHLPPRNVPTVVNSPSASYDSILNKYAGLLGIMPKNITNTCLYEFIEKWYGANYRLGGTDTTGIDCSAFAQRLYNEIYGIDLDRTAKEQFSSCRRLKHPAEAKEGDLVFFHVHSRHISHVGIYLANDYFVHASSSQGVVISSLKDQYWHKFFAGCGRVIHGEFAKN
jgi:cell wall-associated NlpC family hydrolase